MVKNKIIYLLFSLFLYFNSFGVSKAEDPGEL